MYVLRSALSRIYAAAPRYLSYSSSLGQQRSIGTSRGSNQLSGTFYEFRSYIIQPGKVADFMKLTSDNIHLRTAQSELVGYWSVGIGCLNEVFHIWKYGSYKERSAVREALANNEDWQQNYISQMLPMLLHQTNEIVYMVPWAELGKPPKKGKHNHLTFVFTRPCCPILNVAGWHPTMQPVPPESSFGSRAFFS